MKYSALIVYRKQLHLADTELYMLKAYKQQEIDKAKL